MHFLTQLVYPERYGRDDAPSLVIPHQYGVTVGFEWDVYYKVRASMFQQLLLVWQHSPAACVPVIRDQLFGSTHASTVYCRRTRQRRSDYGARDRTAAGQHDMPVDPLPSAPARITPPRHARPRRS